MKRTITAYELVQKYKADYGTLPTYGIECTELQFYADANGYEMPPDDDVMAVCQQMRSWTQPATGQAKLWEA